MDGGMGTWGHGDSFLKLSRCAIFSGNRSQELRNRDRFGKRSRKFRLAISSTEDEYILIAMSGITAVPKWDPTLRWRQLLTFFKSDYTISDSWIIALAHVHASQKPAHKRAKRPCSSEPPPIRYSDVEEN